MRMQQQRMMGPSGSGLPMRGPGPAISPHLVPGGSGPQGAVPNYRLMGGRLPSSMVGVGGNGGGEQSGSSPPQMSPRMSMQQQSTAAVLANPNHQSPQQQFSTASSPASITPPHQMRAASMTSPMQMPSSSPLPSPGPAPLTAPGGTGAGQPHMSPMHHPSPSPQPSMSPSSMQLNQQQHYPNSQSPHSGPSPRNHHPGGHVRYISKTND